MKFLSLIFLFIPTLLISQGWEKTFGSQKSEDIGFSVQQTNDGGYNITGETESTTKGSDDVYLIKTDASGNALWTKTIGGANRDIGQSVYQTLDGGYIITGLTWSFGGGFTAFPMPSMKSIKSEGMVFMAPVINMYRAKPAKCWDWIWTNRKLLPATSATELQWLPSVVGCRLILPWE